MTFRAKTDNPSYHPGRCAEVYCGNDYIGVFGQVHPKVLENFNVSGEVYAMELEVEALYKNRGGIVEYKRLPSSRQSAATFRWSAMKKLQLRAVEACIRDGAGELLETVRLFDVYRGAQIGANKKSLAYTFTMRDHSRSLTDEDADAAMKRILKLLSARTGAELRG